MRGLTDNPKLTITVTGETRKRIRCVAEKTGTEWKFFCVDAIVSAVELAEDKIAKSEAKKTKTATKKKRSKKGTKNA